MERLFTEIEMPLVFTLYDMERNGVKAEGEALKIYGGQLGERIVQLETEIYEEAEEKFNINSPKQLGTVQQYRAESAEYSGPDRAWQADTKGICTGGGIYFPGCRLFSDRASDPGTLLRR